MAATDEMFEPKEVKRLVKLAKKQELNFAFNKGMKPDEHLLALDKRKAPKILEKICKLQGTGKKAAFGTVTAEGKEITFKCEKEIAGMRKAIIHLLKSIKEPMQVFLVDANGNPIDDADADDDDEAAIAAAGAAGEVDPAEEEWNRRHEKARLATAKVLKDGLGDSDKLRAVLSFAQGKAETGDFAAAVKSLNTLEKLLVAAAKDKAGGKGVIAEGIVEKRKFLVTRWQKVPAEVKVELGKLKSAIAVNVPDENPEELCGAIEASLDELIDEIQTAVDESIGAGDAGYATALKTIEQQKQKVQQHKMVQLLKQNPLVPGETFETAVFTALDEVRDALAA